MTNILNDALLSAYWCGKSGVPQNQFRKLIRKILQSAETEKKGGKTALETSG